MDTQDDKHDAIWEVDGDGGIAVFIDRTPRQTYHLLATGALPARKIGGRWVASRKKLREALFGEAAVS